MRAPALPPRCAQEPRLKPRDYAPRRLTRAWFEDRARVPRHSRRFPAKGNGPRGRCVQTVSCELFRAVATPPFGCSASLLLSCYRCWKPGAAFASVPPSLGASCRRYTSYRILMSIPEIGAMTTSCGPWHLAMANRRPLQSGAQQSKPTEALV